MFLILTFSFLLRAEDGAADLSPQVAREFAAEKFCLSSMEKLIPKINLDDRQSVCRKVDVRPNCFSVDKKPIFHFNSPTKNGHRILVIGLIHGDEEPSGTLASTWMSRLEKITPRNTWRVIPLANPDGWERKTRVNATGVDLNRNFPTKDWDELAVKQWAEFQKKDPRRFPGAAAASEPETKCLVEHLEDFKPEFVIAMHTPYGMLDFDGPRIERPLFGPLRWQSIGTFPGSLGRLMWAEQKKPVLTVELKAKEPLSPINSYTEVLQDLAGTVAIRSLQAIKN